MPTISYRDLNRKVVLEGVQAVVEELKTDMAKGHLKPDDFSIRDLFENLVVDQNGESCGLHIMRESMDPRGPQKMMMEATPAAVSLSSFTNITGQIFFNAMLNQFQAEALSVSKMVRTIPTRLSGERMPGVGGLGDASAVISEGMPFPTVGLNEDWIDTPQTEKHGMIVPVTKEAIFFDRTNLLLTRAGEVGFFLGLNKEKRLIDAMFDARAASGVTAHRYNWRGTSYATFQTSMPWINQKATNAILDWTNINAAVQVGNQILDPNTGEAIQTDLKTIVVAEENRQNAMRFINATQNNLNVGGYATSGNLNTTIGPSPMSSQGYEILANRYIKSRLLVSTDWLLADMSRFVAYMENWPLTTVQAPTNSELEFTNDIVFRFKGSERGAAAVLEPRAAVLSTVA
jgi:hypothetical protein